MGGISHLKSRFYEVQLSPTQTLDGIIMYLRSDEVQLSPTQTLSYPMLSLILDKIWLENVLKSETYVTLQAGFIELS
jgi:hypothetical protein